MRMLESQSYDFFMDEFCHMQFWHLPYVKLLPRNYVKALSIWYHNNQTRVDLKICELNLSRCPEQTLKLYDAYEHDVVLNKSVGVWVRSRPNITPEEAFRLDGDLSASRASYLAANSKMGTIKTQSNIEAPLYSAGTLYEVKVRVGTGRYRPFISIVADTGSNLLWVHCKPFNVENFFNPRASPTFRKEIMCNNPTSACRDLPRVSGTSSGYLTRETFEFQSLAKEFDDEEDEKPFFLENITFGCDINGSLADIDGILGLTSDSVSLVSQMGYSRFAYCLGNINDFGYRYNILIIGDGDEIGLHGSQTPLYIHFHYYVRLEGIAVGGRPVDGFGSHMLMVDCGTTYTLIPSQALKNLQTRIEEVIGDRLTKNDTFEYGSSTMLCYVGSVTRDLVWSLWSN
ncbi:eukaryotic aspartyl protease family protein [Striga asiatica]|uniref:Eukaryotic aspartyl protease family protein n=1 Tax=Striga asiatica TaxID=4170 RepID=A0A5A7RK88_STRAF|nr:eukaryotic aspartyl protease family protein [Striga asiatica]